MTSIHEGETVFEVKFQIKTTKFLGRQSGFMAKQAHIEQFNPTRVYKTKNEAIDAAVDSILKLKD